ncbi:MAG: hypothetical protein V2J62_02510 [candidate division KSB1 bacterium]|jgi:hypothetical protein|nr:hypothetical protein [candidate division KSB1 bacterium]
MKTYVMKQKIDSSKQIVLDLPQCREGDEVELIIVVHTLSTSVPSKPAIFDMEQWANQWETDLGEKIQSTDVASLTGRDF